VTRVTPRPVPAERSPVYSHPTAQGPGPARRRVRAVAGALGLALVAGPLAVQTDASATPDGDDLVISEVYGGGGNSGATLTHDFIELFNPTDAEISVDGMSVQYRSASGGGSGVTALSGAVPADGHYLVQQAQGAGGTTPLPAPDATGNIFMSASSGIVFLAEGTAPLSPPAGSTVGTAEIVDLVGYGSATRFETAAAPELSNTTAATRDAEGTDTDDNSADFLAAAPTPTASEGGDPEPPEEPTEATIAEVQGQGDVSPMVGDLVTTQGVVTAAYPTGGFSGFTIQTAGSEPGDASHGIFVFARSATEKVAVGDHVQVTGRVSEFFGLTEITPDGAEDITVLQEPGMVMPAEVTWPTTDAERERLEGMLLAPQGPFTVSDNWNAGNQDFAEIKIAAGTEPLRQPTDVAPFGSAEADAVAAHNAGAVVTLDDGASTNFLGSDAAKDIPHPWYTDDPTVRVGEPVTFVEPVVLDFRFGQWRFQPTAQLVAGDPAGVRPVTFGDTRTAAPEPVGGNLQVASFNVLNYFPTTGDELDGCFFFRDRDGDPVVVGGGCNARGAAEEEDLLRQQAKIVEAINALEAEVVSLEEIENSALFGKHRDFALAHLVDALNADLGAEVWSFVPSPAAVPAPAREDFIRNGFIYKRAAVKAQGDSFIYDGPEFDNARDPLAQVFKPVGGNSKDKFLLVVNHFKSKGSPPSDPDDPNAEHGQGNWNPLRVTQAEALVRFADDLKAETGVEKVYLNGDFNSYSFEDPMRVLHDAGYTSLQQRYDTDPTFLFGGLVGSLDHGLANEAALGTTTGADVWNINSVESPALEYSRHNYNITLLFDATTPYRSSDHDPIVFGVDVTRGGRG
jgi:5'-nucleotidase